MAAVTVNNPTDRNKMILAIVLGAIALLMLLYAFGGSFWGGTSTKVSVTTATPSPTPRRGARANDFQMPTQSQLDLEYASLPITYSPAVFGAPDPGRNIFAFYEPPPPCPDCPTPTPKPPPPPTPAPTPPIFVAYVTPQSVYAGSKGFRVEVHGDRFEPGTKIYFNGMEMPTSFVNAQRVSTDIPANLIAGAGSAGIIVRTPDGRLFSNQVFLSIQPPPTPNFQYIGMIARQHANNDTAYYLEQGKTAPVTARLNDVIGGRFRLVSISPERMIVEDTGLGFRHSVNIQQPAQGTPTFGSGQPGPGGRGFPAGGGYVPMPQQQQIPGINTPVQVPEGSIPGIPDNIPRVNPTSPANSNPQRNNPNSDTKKDDDGQDIDG